MDSTEKNPGNSGKDTGKDRIKAMIILAVLIIIILAGVYYIFILKSDKPVQSANYEIILKDITNNELTMQIYAPDTTDQGLIKINDDILKPYTDSTMTKYIFYFDDRQHTGRFFELFTKGNLSAEDRSEMSHNIAMYYFDKSMTKSNPPCLTKRATQGWRVLKCYN
ncbi:MAG: hypothetical protein ACHQJ4_03295 [Ignavibacteria bacterium]